jgi:hypothetical protein
MLILSSLLYLQSLPEFVGIQAKHFDFQVLGSLSFWLSLFQICLCEGEKFRWDNLEQYLRAGRNLQDYPLTSSVRIRLWLSTGSAPSSQCSHISWCKKN